MHHQNTAPFLCIGIKLALPNTYLKAIPRFFQHTSIEILNATGIEAYQLDEKKRKI